MQPALVARREPADERLERLEAVVEALLDADAIDGRLRRVLVLLERQHPPDVVADEGELEL